MAAPANRLEPIFDTVRTICVGRFLIDLPRNSSVVWGDLHIPFEVDRYPGQAHELNKLLDASTQSLNEERRLMAPPSGGVLKDLGRVFDGAVKGQKHFVGLSRISEDHFAISSFVPVGDDVFVIHGNNLANPSDYQSDLTKLNETALRIVSRVTEVPEGSGFCIDGALVKDAKVQEVERAHIGVQLADFPDVIFSLSMVRKGRKVQSDALEPRFQHAEQTAIKSDGGVWYRRVKFLRRGTKVLKPWSGDEILMHVPAQDRDHDSHQFLFVALGEPKNVYVPTLDVSLNTGVKANRRGGTVPSITDDEALYLWDRLLNSLRVRPVKADTP